MVKDDGRAGEKLKQIASEKGANLPDKMASAKQRELEKLPELSGAKFDQAFAKEEVADNQKAFRAFERKRSPVLTPS